MSAATTPALNVGMPNRPRSTSTGIPAAARRRSCSTKATIASTPPASTNGTGEIPPESVRHHP